MISRLLDDFWAALNVDEIRVKRPTQIFLCGGEIPPEAPGPAKCARHFFYRYLRKINSPLVPDLVLAETIIDAELGMHGFRDLLELERLVAEIVAVILLFVESPGSYAELGAFTENNAILQRLVAVIDTRYRERTNSFVYLGPVQRLLNHNEQSLLYATWLADERNDKVDDESANVMAAALCDRIPTLLRQNGHTGLLSTVGGSDVLNEGEKMCLITGLLDVFQVLSLTETEEALGRFAPISTQMQIKRYLYVLRKLGLVDRTTFSNQYWYFARRKSFVEWSFASSSPRKTTLDWQRYFRDEYKRLQPTDSAARKRLGALNDIIQRSIGGEGNE